MSSSRGDEPLGTDSPDRLAADLVAWFSADASYAIALSGGVDSAVVARAATLAGVRCFAVTSTGPAVSRRELRDAQEIARRVGIDHHWIDAGELRDPRYRANDARRCYHCKSHLFATVAARFPQVTIVTGTNRDDLSDYRPGLQAAQEAAVRAPLAELGLGKDQVRRLARYWRLPISEKPASPCLASRIAYGVEVTEQRLASIDAAEAFLRSLGVADCRVRLHPQDIARIEVPPDGLVTLAQPGVRESVVRRFLELGFRYVALDLQPLRTGSMNQLVVLDRSTPPG